MRSKQTAQTSLKRKLYSERKYHWLYGVERRETGDVDLWTVGPNIRSF